MKKSLLTLILLMLATHSYCQSIQITQVNVAAVTGGINVNLHTISFNGADYIGSSYTITDNVIEVSACYSYNLTLPVLEFVNDIFIPLTGDFNSYTININVWNSSTFDVCNYESLGDTETTTYLGTPRFTNVDNGIVIFPNPTNGVLHIHSISEIKAVEVFDINGRLIQHFSNLLDSKLDLTNMQAGSYLLKLYTEKGNFTEKIVVEP